MADRKSLYDKCDAQLNKVKDFIKKNEDAFDMMDLKLHDAAFFDDFDAYPAIKKAIENHFYQGDTPYYDFADQSYDQFTEWCAEDGLDFRKMYNQVGRTSKFYLHDRNLIDATANGINYENTIYNLVNHFGWPDSFEDTKDGLLDRAWADENWDDDGNIENNVEYIASGEFYQDVEKACSDILKVYKYIKDFKDDQVSIYKDWLENENEWLEDSHPELAEESRSLTVEDTEDGAYYRVVYGYQNDIVKLDRETTDNQAVLDILIDGLEDAGVGEPYLIPIDQAEEEYNSDEYVIGGNHGLALVHNGNFFIEPVTKEKAEELDRDNSVEIYEEGISVLESAEQAAIELAELDAEDGGVHSLDTFDAFAEQMEDMGYDATKELYSLYQKALRQFCADYLESKEVNKMSRVDLMVNKILEGADITKTLMGVDEAAGRLVSVKIIDEPYGKGVEVRDSNGAVYRYAVDTNDPKYYTPEKVMHAVQGLARHNNYDMAKIYNFLKNNTLGDYDKDVSGRTGLASAEIVAEPHGEGLKITFDNGKTFRYTVDQNDEKYDTLDKLKDGAEGMWRHGASVDGLINFLDNHAILYAREGRESQIRKSLSRCVVECKKISLGWVR